MFLKIANSFILRIKPVLVYESMHEIKTKDKKSKPKVKHLIALRLNQITGNSKTFFAYLRR